MPIIQGVKRISPLDLNKNVTIGVAFPLDETNLFKGTQTEKDQAKANLINLLLTQQGERVNLPNFGVGLKNLLFEQQVNLELLEGVLANLRTGLSEDEHTIFISITYRFLLDNSTDNIQLNFN